MLKLRINPRIHRGAGGCTTNKLKWGGDNRKVAACISTVQISTSYVLKLCKYHCSWPKISSGFHPTVGLAYLDYLKKLAKWCTVSVFTVYSCGPIFIDKTFIVKWIQTT